jgi:hypothetical protein
MDTVAVGKMADTFQTLHDVLVNVNQTLDGLVNILKDTAFIGKVGGNAVIHFIEDIQPEIKRVSDKCAELNVDVKASVEAFARGDAEGATRFH